ncbi:hypothetical protein [Xenorhabdus hominickii]|uniref:Uncharacterized protein n=1 Tax=Xenorhabdus hominickii TaxID=351679 RepID=A0A2G0PKC5_XENHO|nr:hypothetical protein [Xenorhabdus hominickii]PHM47431.1 hypothetical protein Xhom_05054 [Xenorhabdus hominickii]
MKKYLLLCLVAGTTLLASMQTYASICSTQTGQAWGDCMVWCLTNSYEQGPGAYAICAFL